MNIAIIVAAGSGKRFGGNIPKQFLKIHRKPILIHTLNRFEQNDSVDEIILVLSEEMIESFSEEINSNNFSKVRRIVSGGDTRAESVHNGFKVAKKLKKPEIIAIHDGARPLVSFEEISQTIKKAKEVGAACLVAEVTDTIKEVGDGKILQTIDRSKLRRALTPQCFRFEILQEAYNQNEIGQIVTDECFLIEKMGFEIAIVEGSAKNIKITREEDLLIAEALLTK